MAKHARSFPRPGPAPLPSRLVSALAAAAITATAAAGCTSDPADPATPGGGDTAAPVVTGDGASSALTGTGPGPGTGDDGPPRTLADLEARWAADRAAMVRLLSNPDYGVGPDGILRGPGGLEVDLGACPAGWSDTEGLDDTTIRLGHTTAQTGNLASSRQVTAGLQAYLDLINTQGGIGGRQLELLVRDDGFVAANTAAAVEQLLADDRPFLVTTLGSPTTLAVYDALNAACVPHPFVVSSHPAWGDPANHPWTTGLQMTPSSEAALWGAWIEANLADALPVDVAALVMDNEFGHLYEQGFQLWATDHPEVVASFTPVRHPATAASVSAEMSTVAAAGPEVFLSMTAGRPCTLAMTEAAANGLAASARALFTPSLCRDPATYLEPVGPAAEGWRIVGGGLKSATDPRWADDPYLAFVTGALADNGLDPADGLAITGFGLFGWAHVEAMRIAAELPGGLTRTNLLLALRGLDLHHPFLADGVAFAASGLDDGYYLEGSDILVFDVASQTWNQDGPVIDGDGTTPPCAWDGSACGPQD